MSNGGVWNYRNEEGNHGELILAMNRDQHHQQLTTATARSNTAAAAVVKLSVCSHSFNTNYIIHFVIIIIMN